MENINQIYHKALEYLSQGSPVILETSLNGDSGSLHDDMTRALRTLTIADVPTGSSCVKVEKIRNPSGITYREPLFPAERLLVLGAGHIAMPVCEFAAKVGFSVTVCDDRPEFVNRERFPLAQEIICDSFANAIRRLKVTGYDYVVTLTRGHRWDADCLRELLIGNFPAYLGLIGSRRRVKGLLAMLAEEGYSVEAMQRIHTPIGLDIGAVTPEEIAVAILAELIACKRKPEGQAGRLCSGSDMETEMLTYLATAPGPMALVTVVETKGSTPRAAGAKMAVNPAGQVTGSIGGGCSEGLAIREAVKMIGSGRWRLLDIDLTGDVAEAEGMVCGGIMRVLIEDAV